LILMKTNRVDDDCARRHAIWRWRAGQWQQAHDDVAEEVPVALEYNGISHAVMLVTPSDLEEFALGFSLSEGILASPDDCYEIEAEQSDAGITLHLRISSAAFMLLKDRRRNMAGRTGCGLCGTESLGQVLRPLPQLAPRQTLSAGGIRRALAGLELLQPLNQITGGTHAAAWCLPSGELYAGFEDVGRHNALDKLIGFMAKTRMDFADGFAVLTSRASVELVQKAATVGIHALVAISAPTALAVRTAQACGMTLVAFARGDRFVAYANSGNIRLD
jgi:FdhD protein